jgi:hypothetical protein
MRDENKTVIRQGKREGCRGEIKEGWKNNMGDESLIMWENDDVSWMGDEDARWKGG